MEAVFFFNLHIKIVYCFQGQRGGALLQDNTHASHPVELQIKVWEHTSFIKCINLKHRRTAAHLHFNVEQQTVIFVLDFQEALRTVQIKALLRRKKKTQENKTTHHHYPAETRLIGLYQAEKHTM